MAKTFTTMVGLENYLENACEKAVKITCEMLLGKLQNLIMSEYYDAYDNKTYDRTYQFYRSAMMQMLSKNVGEIFMDSSAMNYPFSGWGWGWTGDLQLEEGNKGIHGGWSTNESKSHHYWKSFEEYCNTNAIKLLRQNLVAQGLTLSK